MVKIGIIYDGETEQVIFSSKNKKFKELLEEHNFELAGAIKYSGGKIERDTNLLINRNKAKKVIIIKDLEQLATEETLITQLKKKETITDKNEIFIVKKMTEAWFLSDTDTLKKILRTRNLRPFNNPEGETNPHRTLKNRLGQKYKDLSKPDIAKLFLKNGFTIKNATEHKQCHSAKAFLKMLKKLQTKFEKK